MTGTFLDVGSGTMKYAKSMQRTQQHICMHVNNSLHVSENKYFEKMRGHKKQRDSPEEEHFLSFNGQKIISWKATVELINRCTRWE